MIITYYGLTCFRLQVNGLSLLIDPVDVKTGLKLPRMQNDIMLLSHGPKSKASSDKTFLADCPGEYEIKGCFIYGIPVNNNKESKVMFLVELEGIRIAHLGILAQPKLTETQLDKLEGVDILMVPVGGGESLTSNQATEIISDLEPRLVIPMYYQLPGLKIKLDSLEKFKKELAVKSESADKLKITKKELLQEETRMVILNPAK